MTRCDFLRSRLQRLVCRFNPRVVSIASTFQLKSVRGAKYTMVFGLQTTIPFRLRLRCLDVLLNKRTSS